LRAVLRALVEDLLDSRDIDLTQAACSGRMGVYESRAAIYLACIAERERTFAVINRTVVGWLEREAAADLLPQVLRVLDLDRALCPRTGPAARVVAHLDFAADLVAERLMRVELPARDAFDEMAVALEIDHPGQVGEVLRDPDGGSWMRGRIVA